MGPSRAPEGRKMPMAQWDAEAALPESLRSQQGPLFGNGPAVPGRLRLRHRLGAGALRWPADALTAPRGVAGCGSRGPQPRPSSSPATPGRASWTPRSGSAGSWNPGGEFLHRLRRRKRPSFRDRPTGTLALLLLEFHQQDGTAFLGLEFGGSLVALLH